MVLLGDLNTQPLRITDRVRSLITVRNPPTRRNGEHSPTPERLGPTAVQRAQRRRPSRGRHGGSHRATRLALSIRVFGASECLLRGPPARNTRMRLQRGSEGVGQGDLDELGGAALGEVAAALGPRAAGAAGQGDADEVAVGVGVRAAAARRCRPCASRGSRRSTGGGRRCCRRRRRPSPGARAPAAAARASAVVGLGVGELAEVVDDHHDPLAELRQAPATTRSSSAAPSSAPRATLPQNGAWPSGVGRTWTWNSGRPRGRRGLGDRRQRRSSCRCAAARSRARGPASSGSARGREVGVAEREHEPLRRRRARRAPRGAARRAARRRPARRRRRRPAGAPPARRSRRPGARRSPSRRARRPAAPGRR